MAKKLTKIILASLLCLGFSGHKHLEKKESDEAIISAFNSWMTHSLDRTSPESITDIFSQSNQHDSNSPEPAARAFKVFDSAETMQKLMPSDKYEYHKGLQSTYCSHELNLSGPESIEESLEQMKENFLRNSAVYGIQMQYTAMVPVSFRYNPNKNNLCASVQYYSPRRKFGAKFTPEEFKIIFGDGEIEIIDNPELIYTDANGWLKPKQGFIRYPAALYDTNFCMKVETEFSLPKDPKEAFQNTKDFRRNIFETAKAHGCNVGTIGFKLTKGYPPYIDQPQVVGTCFLYYTEKKF